MNKQQIKVGDYVLVTNSIRPVYNGKIFQVLDVTGEEFNYCNELTSILLIDPMTGRTQGWFGELGMEVILPEDVPIYMLGQ